MEGKICVSCKRKIVNDAGTVSFFCPSCGKQEMVRCQGCRSNAIKYTCGQCNFVGPN